MPHVLTCFFGVYVWCVIDVFFDAVLACTKANHWLRDVSVVSHNSPCFSRLYESLGREPGCRFTARCKSLCVSNDFAPHGGWTQVCGSEWKFLTARDLTNRFLIRVHHLVQLLIAEPLGIARLQKLARRDGLSSWKVIFFVAAGMSSGKSGLTYVYFSEG